MLKRQGRTGQGRAGQGGPSGAVRWWGVFLMAHQRKQGEAAWAGAGQGRGACAVQPGFASCCQGCRLALPAGGPGRRGRQAGGRPDRHVIPAVRGQLVEIRACRLTNEWLEQRNVGLIKAGAINQCCMQAGRRWATLQRHLLCFGVFKQLRECPQPGAFIKSEAAVQPPPHHYQCHPLPPRPTHLPPPHSLTSASPLPLV